MPDPALNKVNGKLLMVRKIGPIADKLKGYAHRGKFVLGFPSSLVSVPGALEETQAQLELLTAWVI